MNQFCLMHFIFTILNMASYAAAFGCAAVLNVAYMSKKRAFVSEKLKIA